jgi:hypothetical protein
MHASLNRLAGALAFVGGALWAAPSVSQSLPQPSGEVVLTVAGAIATTNAGGRAVFDRDMLEALGVAVITTATPWYEGEVTFEGVPAASVMDAVAADGETVTASARDGYVAEIPLSDFREHGVIFAWRADGEPLAGTDKGPLFIVYPYDSDPQLQADAYYDRSVWALTQLSVE